MAFLWLCVSLGNAVSCSDVSESFGLHIISGCRLCRVSPSPPFALCRVLYVERSKEVTSAIKSLVLTVMPLGEEVALNTIMLLYTNQTFALIEIKLSCILFHFIFYFILQQVIFLQKSTFLAES